MAGMASHRIEPGKPIKLHKERSRLEEPKSLVEDRVAFAGPNSELSIYDTYDSVNDVALSAGELLFCGMISGRKIMHDADQYRTEFLPEESFVMAPGERILIDFPEASLSTPTTCLTVEITRDRVESICNRLNDVAPLDRQFNEWEYHDDLRVHAYHTKETQQLLERLTQTFIDVDGSSERNVLIDLGVSELVVRMLKYQTRRLVLNTCQRNPELNGISTAVSHIQNNIDQALDVEKLSRLACMSRSRFFSEFKKHLGCTPSEFLQQARLQKAADLLARGISATEVCYQLGYRDPSHFSKRFNSFYGVTPSNYRRVKAS